MKTYSNHWFFLFIIMLIMGYTNSYIFEKQIIASIERTPNRGEKIRVSPFYNMDDAEKEALCSAAKREAFLLDGHYSEPHGRLPNIKLRNEEEDAVAERFATVAGEEQDSSRSEGAHPPEVKSEKGEEDALKAKKEALDKNNLFHVQDISSSDRVYVYKVKLEDRKIETPSSKPSSNALETDEDTNLAKNFFPVRDITSLSEGVDESPMYAYVDKKKSKTKKEESSMNPAKETVSLSADETTSHLNKMRLTEEREDYGIDEAISHLHKMRLEERGDSVLEEENEYATEKRFVHPAKKTASFSLEDATSRLSKMRMQEESEGYEEFVLLRCQTEPLVYLRPGDSKDEMIMMFAYVFSIEAIHSIDVSADSVTKDSYSLHLLTFTKAVLCDLCCTSQKHNPIENGALKYDQIDEAKMYEITYAPHLNRPKKRELVIVCPFDEGTTYLRYQSPNEMKIMILDEVLINLLNEFGVNARGIIEYMSTPAEGQTESEKNASDIIETGNAPTESQIESEKRPDINNE